MTKYGRRFWWLCTCQIRPLLSSPKSVVDSTAKTCLAESEQTSRSWIGVVPGVQKVLITRTHGRDELLG
jgi:hypothetical protein